MSLRYAAVSVFLVCAIAAQNKGRNPAADRAADLAAIKALHERDAAAAKRGDVNALAGLWAEDGVALPPGEQPVKGIAALRKWLQDSHPSNGKYEVTEYVLDFQEEQILGDEAFEWARTSITVRPKGGGAGMRASGNLMRILQRQPDGAWKVSRAIWNLGKPEPAPAAR